MTSTSPTTDVVESDFGEHGRPWRTFEITEVRDERGAVVVYPDGARLPHVFDVNRVYFLFTDTPGAVRGNHAHRRLWQVMVCLNGSVTVDLDDGSAQESFLLDSPTSALMIGPRVWRRLHGFTPGTICAVLASEAYDPDEYLHTYQDFRAFVQEHRGSGA